jgi:queuosine precursor transporter
MFGIEKLDLLIAVYMFSVAVSELMGGKTFPITNALGFPLSASVAIFVLPIIFAIVDIITEVLGKKRSQSVVRSGILVVFLILIYSLLTTHLPPSIRFKAMEPHYQAVFSVSARIAASSLIAFAVSELMDIAIFTKLRQRLGKNRLWFRTNLSNFISEFFDSFVFIFLAFYVLDKSFSYNFPFLMGLILPYWFLKCVMSIVTTPLVYWGVGWLKK